jgi:transcriptional regulator with XRE-family HTH domain
VSSEDPVDVVSLASRLKEHRESLGLSQSQAARELEVARTAYRLWELEAAKPAPDRWRLVARWLGVSMSTLLLAEGLINEEEADQQAEIARRVQGETGERSDDVAAQQVGDFFQQAQAFLDRSLERGVIDQDEADRVGAVFERIRAGLPDEETSTT